MVAHVLRLRLDLLIGALRGDRARAVRAVLIALLIIAATVVVCLAVLSLDDDSADVAHAVTVLGGSAVGIAVLLGPAVGGLTDQLDPRRFAVFGLPAGTLSLTLIAGAVISLPSLAFLAVASCVAVLWTERGTPAALAWCAAMLGWLTTLLLARVSMAVSALLFRERRNRELTGLFILAVIVIIVPVAVFFGSLEWKGVVPSPLRAVVEVLAFTPVGAAWAIPGLTELGVGAAPGAIVIAVLTLLVLGGCWYLLVRRMLNSIERPDVAAQRGGLGWFALLPGTPAGAVAARSLVYWMRDRRYIVNVAAVPIASVIAALPLLIAGVPAPVVALVPIPIMALFFGWMPHNDIAYDSTAIWLHLVSGVRGIADRLGRLVPIVLIAVPILAIATPIAIAIYGRWALLPAMIGVAANLFLAGLGLSSIASVLSPYPVTRPGDSPFQQPQRSGSGVGAQALALIGAVVLSAPTLWLAWRALVDDASGSVLTMWVGLGIGMLVLAVGILVGALLFDRRGSRIMEFAEAI